MTTTKKTTAALLAATLLLQACSHGDTTPAAAHPTQLAGRPNILFILADDLGYSDIGAFGGEISTPNLDALAKAGRLLTNHHVGTVCAITRSMLISGTDHHLVGEGVMGVPNDERQGLPGYEGHLNDRALSLAQLLKDAGYHTYMAGKWHLGSNIPAAGVALGSSGQTPDQWGFEQSYALLGGAARNHFGHEPADSRSYTDNGVYVQPGQPGQPGGAGGSPAVFYSTDFYTQRLIANIDQHRGDGKPFFAYAAYTSPHWPLQVPEPWLSKYKGHYDAGYDAIRAARIAKQKQLGLVPQDFTPFAGEPETLASSSATAANNTPAARYLNAVNTAADGYRDHGPGRINKKWASLTPLEKKAQARYMEIYAGMVENLDHNVGRLIRHLKDIGEYDNTLIVFQSDNGAEGSPIAPATTDPRAPDEANAAADVYARLGTDNGQTVAQRLQYGLRWAEVSATPFRQAKAFMGEGGIASPLIVRLPGQTKSEPQYAHLTHVTDLTATFLDVAQAKPPTTPAPARIDAKTGLDKNKGKVVYGDRLVYPVTGRTLLPVLLGNRTGSVRTGPFGEESYGRAQITSADGRWKALWTEPPIGPLDGHWALYDLGKDRGENNDVSAAHPEQLKALLEQWKAYMASVGGVEPLRPGNGGGARGPAPAP